MQDTANTLFLDSPVPEGDLAMGVFIAYEDIAAGKRAKETCNVLAESVGVNWIFDTQVASFTALRIPRLRYFAAEEAAKANILFISCHDGKLPLGVNEWLQLCLARCGGPMALVALFSCPRLGATHAIAAETYLAAMAKQARMQFFSGFDSAPGQSQRRGPSASALGPLGKRISL
ncbi:MAG TPA: hypothetical protein VMQ67_03150 [Candidatus Saccharimonadales bacterium]|nr:hypothetical protein [Candidatus Saccharimonadales bacterium]